MAEVVINSTSDIKKQIESANVKLTFFERVQYAVAEYGYNSSYYWISAFLTIYYTDVIGVEAAAVSLLLLAVRVFDGLNDPFIGSLADRTKSRWGRYRPWVFWGAIAMCILIVLTFAANPGWSYSTKILWMWITYTLTTVASTCCNMPFGALNGVITSNGHERVKLSGMRMVFANVGGNVTGLVAVPLIAAFTVTAGSKADERGYFWAVLIMCAIGLPTLLYSAYAVKERLQPPPNQNKISMSQRIGTLVKNPPMIILTLGFFGIGFIAYGRMAVLMYYFTYVTNNPALMSYVGLIGILCSIVGSGFITPYLYALTKHKGKSTMYMWFVQAIGFIAMFFFDANGAAWWVLYTISQLAGAAWIGIQYGMVGDAVDYGEYKIGIRSDGFLASFCSFGMKFGGAVGPAVFLAVYASLGYVPNQAQSTTVLSAMNMSISLIPGILALALGIIYSFYKLSGEEHEKITAELERRREV